MGETRLPGANVVALLGDDGEGDAWMTVHTASEVGMMFGRTGLCLVCVSEKQRGEVWCQPSHMLGPQTEGRKESENGSRERERERRIEPLWSRPSRRATYGTYHGFIPFVIL